MSAAQGDSRVHVPLEACDPLAQALARIRDLEAEVARLRTEAVAASRAALTPSEARFRMLADLVPAIVIEGTAEAGNLYVNRYYQEFTGRPAEALLGLGWQSVTFPEDLARIAPTVAEANQAGQPFEIELRLRRHDGAWRWFLMRSTGVADHDLGTRRWFGIGIDIHEHKLAETALRESEARFRALADSAPVMIWEAAPDGRATWFNRPWLTMTGRTLAQEIGDGWTEAIHPDDLGEVLATFRDALARCVPYQMDYRIRRADGAWRTLQEAGAPRCDPDGTCRGLIGSCVDVTEARAAQTALRDAALDLERRVAERTAQLAESEARFRAFFEATEDCLFTIGVTEDGRFVHEGYNPHGERRSGYSNEVLRGRTPEEFMSRELAEATTASLRTVLAEGTQRFTKRLALPAGEGVFDSLMVPIRDERGRVARILVASREVTEQHRLEEELRQTQKMQAIGQLTGGVAHDFNNLLTGVLGSLELLEREVTTARGQRLLDAARRSAERGARLTEQLLAFARRQRLEPRPIDLNALVAGMAGLLHSTLGGAVRIETRLAPELWPALADPTQLELAILNVAINARDARPADGLIVIETANAEAGAPETAEDPPAGSYATVAVHDRGDGIGPDVLARVFEPFFTTKEVGLGSGLGLPQVLGVAKQLGGGVRIASTPGAGTSVRIFLPRASAVATAATPPAVAPPDGLDGKRVLVVDDDADVCAATAELLEEFGCTVLRAHSGAQAIALLADGTAVDAALLDYSMPGMNGAEAARQLRVLRPGLPLVFATGYADVAATKGLPAQVLRKPFRASDLAAAFATLLR
jgi:PAS domain S-box-containing protein